MRDPLKTVAVLLAALHPTLGFSSVTLFGHRRYLEQRSWHHTRDHSQPMPRIHVNNFLRKSSNRAAVFMAKRGTAERRQALSRAARAVPLKVVTVGKGADAAAEAYCAVWANKVRRYAPLEQVVVRNNPGKVRDPAAQMSAEGERAAKLVGQRDRLVLLDERGREMSSEAFADLIASTGDEGYSGLVFAVGGPFGHGPQMRERANDVIRLSGCVLNHQVARVVLLEQLYRAWTILHGEPYHH